MKRWFSLGALMLVCASVPYVCSAARVNSATAEVKTARAHALMAAHADSLAKTHTHLQHVVNCIVGPDAPEYVANAANPCKTLGAGALPDTGDNAAMQARLKQALMAAESGINADSLKSAQKAAQDTVDKLSVPDKAKDADSK